MIRIEITDEPINTREGVKDGRAWKLREQAGYVFNGNRYPARFLFRLGDNHPGYAPGAYVLDPSSIAVGERDSLAFARELKLTPEAKAKPV